jgi:hypothetical protein
VSNDLMEATSALNASREQARRDAWPTIAVMVSQLVEAMGGATLRGLPNLASSAAAYRGLHVRATNSGKALDFPRVDRGSTTAPWGRETLILNMRCELVMARANDLGEVEERPATAEDVLAEDVENVAETITEACELHLEAAARATAVYDDITQLANRLRLALGGK